MKVFTQIAELRSYLKQSRLDAAKRGDDLKIGFVPTMGFLHEGHASLMTKAREDNDLVVLSIFVNPIQFGPNEDFERYPRDPQKDTAIALENGVDVVFLPGVEEMYPSHTKTIITVKEITSYLCGASRPGHFDGVTTVVAKLFHMIQPSRAYFGQKDAQQVAVITQMVSDLNMDVEIIPCPIVREHDGLALSSRNVYLSQEQRNAALVLSRMLQEAKSQAATDVNLTIGELRSQIIQGIQQEELAVIDYVELSSFPGLLPLEENSRLIDNDGDILIALAVKFGTTRLIDNVILTKKGVISHV
jgi:pantoate--beta-alanine ligase